LKILLLDNVKKFCGAGEDTNNSMVHAHFTLGT